VVGVMGYLSPTSASVGCGLNLRVAAATLSHSTVSGPLGGSYTFLGAPILMCNQYQTPVDINAANFKSCTGISDFCKSAKGDALVECWKQCARIQIDQLTNICWTMAGSGRLDFKDTVFDKAVEIAQKPTTWVAYGGAATVGFLLAGPLGAKVGLTVVEAGYTWEVGHEKKAKILRCFRYRVVNPIIGPDRKTIDYYDYSAGESWSYGLDTSQSTANSNLCKPTDSDPFCSYGGIGVSYLNDLSTGDKFTINGNVVNAFNGKDEYNLGEHLNYNISDPRNQICYIAYYQGGSGSKFTIRSCKSWNEYTGNAVYMN
ncbi:MAG: hypothetical protein NTY99_01640, partial [DPANN group archaeon]|nr:hypothetical protein [DPANN group archaeon]